LDQETEELMKKPSEFIRIGFSRRRDWAESFYLGKSSTILMAIDEIILWII